MLIRKVLLVTLLANLFYIGPDDGKNAAEATTISSQMTTPPSSLYGFVPYIFQNMRHLLGQTVQGDVKTVQNLVNTSELMVKHFFNNTKAIGVGILKTLSDLRALGSVNKSTKDTIGKIIDLGVNIDAIVVDVLELMNSGEKFLYNLYTSITDILNMLYKAFRDNAINIQSMVTLIPTQVYKELMNVVSKIKAPFMEVYQKLQSLLLQDSKSVTKRDTESQHSVNAAIHQAEMAILQTNLIMTILEVQVSNAMQNFGNKTIFEIHEIIKKTGEDFQDAGSKIKDVKTDLEQTFFAY